MIDDLPKFDHSTMVEEWRDYLINAGYNDPNPVLLAALVTQHAKRFEEELKSLGIIWKPLEGEFRAEFRPLADAPESVPADPVVVSYWLMHSVWEAEFEAVAEAIDFTDGLIE